MVPEFERAECHFFLRFIHVIRFQWCAYRRRDQRVGGANVILLGSVAKFVFNEFGILEVIEFMVPSFSILLEKLNFATEPS